MPSNAAKRKRMAEVCETLEDLTDDTVAEIITTISDPNYMTGPDVRFILILYIYLLRISTLI